MTATTFERALALVLTHEGGAYSAATERCGPALAMGASRGV